MAAAAALGQPRAKEEANAERVVPAESKIDEGLPAEGSLDRLWTYTDKAAALRYLNGWIDQLRWQRLEPFQKLAEMLLRHQEGLLNYCQVKVRFGVVEAINGNIRLLIRCGRGYRDKDYLLLKAQRMASLKTEMVVLQKAA